MDSLTTSGGDAAATPEGDQKIHRLRNELACRKMWVPFSDRNCVFELPARYTIVGAIHSGQFGDVAEATSRALPDGPTLAVKKIHGVFETPRNWITTLRELTMLLFFEHPNLVRAVDIVIPLGSVDEITPHGVLRCKQVFTSVYAVMDRMPGTLRDVLDEDEKFDGVNPLLQCPDDLSNVLSHNPRWKSLHGLTSPERAYFLFQILCGLQHMHQCGVVHRDLKPENVLVGDGYSVKLCDFGQSRAGSDPAAELFDSDVTNLGLTTQWYASPESLRFLQRAFSSGDFEGHDPSDAVGGNRAHQHMLSPVSWHAVDIWAAGCIAAEMLIGKPLFDCHSAGGALQLQCIMNILGRPTAAEADSLRQLHSYGMAESLEDPRVPNHENRLEQVLRAGLMCRPYTGDAVNESVDDRLRQEELDPEELALIQSMLRFDPNDRVTAEQALCSPLFAEYQHLRPTTVVARPCPIVPKRHLQTEDVARDEIWGRFVGMNPQVAELLSDISPTTPTPTN